MYSFQFVSGHDVKQRIKDFNFIFNLFRTMLLNKKYSIPGPFVFQIINITNN